MILFLHFLLSSSCDWAKIYQAPKTVFDPISKHIEVRQKNSVTRPPLYSLLGVWKYDQTQSFVFDVSKVY